VSDPTGRLVVMGSGETTPTMVTPHQRVLGDLGASPDAVLLETPYGFQENAGEITARTRDYFATNVGHDVRPLGLRRVSELSPAELESVLVAVEEADWVFAGPGSPSYLLREWRRTRLPEVLRTRLRAARGATVFASAAAVTLGAHAVPVYEIYKVGEEPRWLEGLDLLQPLGLDCVLIPHFDNAEGGTHDTRYCYLGERRLAAMEAELPADTWVLGVDEHTAVTLHLASGRVTIEGRGGLTVRTRDGATTFGADDDLTVERLVDTARGRPAAAAAPPASGPPGPADEQDPGADTPFLEEVAGHRRDFDAALDRDDAIAAADAILALATTIADWSSDTQRSDEMDRAHGELRSMVVRLGRVAAAGLHDHRDLLAPHVELLLELRDAARERGDYAAADRIRDALVAGDVEVRDTADGTEWVYEP
jgi:peptidase E